MLFVEDKWVSDVAKFTSSSCKVYGLILPFVNAGNSREVVWLLIIVAAAVLYGKHKFPSTQTLFTTFLGDLGFRVDYLRYPLYRLCYKSISFHGNFRWSLLWRTIDIKITIQVHKETRLHVIYVGLLTTNPRTRYLPGLLHPDDVTTTLCKRQIFQEQINNEFIVRCINEFSDILILFWDLCADMGFLMCLLIWCLIN
jgi:hypothetical protein